MAESLSLAPATLSLVGVIVLVQVVLTIKRIPLSSVGLNYQTAVQRKQAWRGVTAAFCHSDEDASWKGVVHMLINALALVSASLVENKIGSFEFAKSIYLLLLFSTGNILLVCSLVKVVSQLNPAFERFSDLVVSPWYVTGMSGAIWGLFVMMSILVPYYEDTLPTLIIPVIYIVTVACFMPRANVFAIVSGGLFGTALAYGGFTWVSPYFFLSLLFWTLVGFVINLKMYSTLRLSCIRIETQEDWSNLREVPVPSEIVDGRVVFDETVSARDFTNVDEGNAGGRNHQAAERDGDGGVENENDDEEMALVGR
mmetsp:Transcript_2384/g.4503  ORF Transcript_2384/g.4503 Transcript_2384/m.4503 type:complete len:312 (-) Transcript_2384:108-1043(-)